MIRDYDVWRECVTCGNQCDIWSSRIAVGSLECRDCERGLVPERKANAGPPSSEYMAALRALRRAEGVCVECGTPPNGDQLSRSGLCRACVLAMETEQETERKAS